MNKQANKWLTDSIRTYSNINQKLLIHNEKLLLTMLCSKCVIFTARVIRIHSVLQLKSNRRERNRYMHRNSITTQRTAILLYSTSIWSF